ncbi:conserved Plasmodium protein, unknown function [Plasmodium gallinaceum]|uniref:Uncharacterized protein n=1 Tax=Plasmodium gallinaceum TaxID=5849 RepID=A0A1J1GRH7_PLAGA|nr:conserved Plasmodium protein, unknown function [Plasmodium gallinaceum]CRG95026.1 conserved Plasmodium protein, unknown function [Plasmodium gallinaceum]
MLRFNLIFFLKFFFFFYLVKDCTNKKLERSITNKYNCFFFFFKINNTPFFKKKLNNTKKNLLKARKIDQKKIKRIKNYQYAIKHMYDKNGKRIKQINKEKKSLKKKKLFDYEGFKVDKIFTCLSEEDMEELREEELKRKSGEILYNNKYIDNYGVESENDINEV